MATIFNFFLVMVLTQVIIIPNLRFFGSTVDFIKIVEVSEFPIGLYVVSTFLPTAIQPMGNSLTSRIFIKSAEYLTSLKFGLMITWVNTMSKKFFVAIATSVN